MIDDCKVKTFRAMVDEDPGLFDDKERFKQKAYSLGYPMLDIMGLLVMEGRSRKVCEIIEAVGDDSVWGDRARIKEALAGKDYTDDEIDRAVQIHNVRGRGAAANTDQSGATGCLLPIVAVLATAFGCLLLIAKL